MYYKATTPSCFLLIYVAGLQITQAPQTMFAAPADKAINDVEAFMSTLEHVLPASGPRMNSDAQQAQLAPAAVPNSRRRAALPTLKRRRQQLEGTVVATATKLLPLLELLEAIKPHTTSESVFRTRRKKINAQLAIVYGQLRQERPKREKLVLAFQTVGELVREEAQDISQDELKEAAREFILATLKNAPAIINAAHQAKLLS
ncbi:hypothetical protein [Hymenobacter sp. BT190]|uniref:hypothetical protein n=1 Tax=Hymenobacter sp. BT190 TaxID=2763505 RepID=UPI0016516D09|nr:hypothetical protein [Hymenobacter sp. BT190]MBC6696840.1 hypothetical protein [Hymenobacter sp. BT190]